MRRATPSPSDSGHTTHGGADKWDAVDSDGRILTTILERQVNREQKMAELFG